jgi:Na+-driven multidrug efflux pump
MNPWFIYLLLPFAISALGLRVARSIQKGRWLIHVACISLLIVGTPLAYVWLTTSDEIEKAGGPNPGAGFAFLAVLAAVFLAAATYLRRARGLPTLNSMARN